MTEKELQILFKNKMAEWGIPFNEANWEAFTQMIDPAQPLSEQEFRKLYKDKLEAASFQFNPAAWEELEAQLGPEGGMSDEEMRQLFEKKVSESSFAFNEENWSRMEHLLDEQVERPFLFYWRSVAAILILALSTSLLWWPSDLALEPSVLENGNIGTINNAQKSLEEPFSNTQEGPASQRKARSNKEEAPLKEMGSTLDGEDLAAAPPPVALKSKEEALAVANPAPLALAEDFNRNEPVKVVASNLDWNAMSALTEPNMTLKNFQVTYQAPQFSPKAEPYVPVTFTSLYAVGGPNISPGFNGQIAPAYNAGLVYEYGLNEYSSFEVGLIYNQAAVGIETLSDSTFFGLSSTNVNTHRHYKSIASLRVPLSYRLKVTPKHSLNLGVYADAMLQVRMDETITTTIFKQEPKVENRVYRQPMNSFEAFNFGANIAYAYQYSDRLSIGMTYNLGLSDITKDQSAGFETDHRPEQLSLDLRYRLFKR